MLKTAALISLLILADLPADVSTLDGQRLTGELQSISAKEVVVQVDGESRTIPVSNLQEVRPKRDEGQASPLTVGVSPITVTLHDGSLLLPSEFSATSRQATVTSSLLGQLQVPKGNVAHVRFARMDQSLAPAWQALLEREHRNDLVIVRKGEALDHVEGVVGTIDAAKVNLLLDGNTIPIPRNRVFGVIYAKTGAAVRPLCSFDLTDGQQLAAAAAQLEGETFTVEMTSGEKITVPAEDVRRIDFSLGKIRSLADLEPTSVEYPADLLPQLARVWQYRRGQNSRGAPLLLGGQTYDDGLWIHSGTKLRYRLGREYRRLNGLMGIDEDIGECMPEVGVIIRGDGRELLNTKLSRGDDPHALDLDVAGIRELEIEVVSTDPDGVCEHLDLVEARLIK